MTDTVEIQQWVSNGAGMMYNTACLDFDHPLHPYNQIKAQGKRPEDYGYKHPITEKYENKSRDELIEIICDMEKTILAMERSGFL